MSIRKPEWLRVKYYGGENLEQVEAILKRYSLNTVCEEASCPNRMECFDRKTATFMTMGNECTRNCTFCNVNKGEVQPLDSEEPMRVAQAAKAMHLKHVVITSVTRDDLPDGGAEHFAQVIKSIKAIDKKMIIEVLIPDLQGNISSLETVVNAEPNIINHNIETVPRLYREVRPMAIYDRSLEVLGNVKKIDSSITTKSGIMVGLGEDKKEVVNVLRDLRNVDCNLLTIGQYLPPSKEHYPLIEYIHPDIFEEYKKIGMALGFDYIASGPLVRSSYHADQAFIVKNS